MEGLFQATSLAAVPLPARAPAQQSHSSASLPVAAPFTPAAAAAVAQSCRVHDAQLESHPAAWQQLQPQQTWCHPQRGEQPQQQQPPQPQQQQQQHYEQQQPARQCEEADSSCGLRHRTLAFASCVARSPLLQSALLTLELNGRQPPAGGTQVLASGPQWTLAQLLALHLRTGSVEATGGDLLVALWLLEATHDATRSLATTCLPLWLQQLKTSSPQLAAATATDWPVFLARLQQAFANTQVRLLQRLDWQVQLDFNTEVWPCYRLLFDPEFLAGPQLQGAVPSHLAAHPPAQHSTQPAYPALAGAESEAAEAAAAAHDLAPWAFGMRALCAFISQVRSRAVPDAPACPACPACPAASVVGDSWQAGAEADADEVMSHPSR